MTKRTRRKIDAALKANREEATVVDLAQRYGGSPSVCLEEAAAGASGTGL